MEARIFAHPDFEEIDVDATNRPQLMAIPFGESGDVLCKHTDEVAINLVWNEPPAHPKGAWGVVALRVPTSNPNPPRVGVFMTMTAQEAEETAKHLLEMAAMLRRGGGK